MKTVLAVFFFLAVVSAQGQATRGVAGDLWADRVLGQPDFGSLSFNQVTASSVFLPAGLAADPNPTRHRLYVWDSGNNRVLGFSDTTKFTPNAAPVSFGFAADIVIGQSSFTYGGSNGDNNDQTWPAYTGPSRISLSGMWQRQGSILEGGSNSHMVVDPATGDLYVADMFNSRVLRFAYGDLVPGATGVSASGVWGQPDYTSFLINQGQPMPTDHSFGFGGAAVASIVGPCTDPYGGENAGVGFDSQHNLWVADCYYNRVMRFPAGGGGIPQATADLVLGQPDFASNGTSHMGFPLAVRVDSRGNVYVLDFANSRILVYDAKDTAGKSAVAAASLTWTADLDSPQDIDMDLSDHLWVVNTLGGTYNVGNIVEFQPQFGAANAVTNLKPINALMQDTIPPVAPGSSAVQTRPIFSFLFGGDVNSAWITYPQTLAVDGNGNVYTGTKGGIENIFRFPGPIPTPHSGSAYSADVEVFKQSESGMFNQIGWNGINVVFGVAVGQDTGTPQVIVSDSYRLDYWNIPGGPQGLSNGQVPDGYAGVDSSSVTLPGTNGHSFTRIRVDHSTGATGNQHLWAIDNQYTAQLYDLPLTNYASAGASVQTHIPVLGAPSSLVDWTGVGGLSGLNDVMPCGSVSAPYAPGPVSYLWIADNYHGRVFRVRDPLGKLGSGPVVDILIGETSAANDTCGNFGTYSGGSCNGMVPVDRTTLDWPGSITLDHAGNLYVCDFSLETAGNWRLLEFDASVIEQAGQAAVSQNAIQFLSATPYNGASHIYQKHGVFTGTCDAIVEPIDICMPLCTAFPSGDQAMVVAGFERVPVVVPNPHTDFDTGDPANPWTHLNDFYSNLYSMTFDAQDNLYTVDSNRARVLVYIAPFSTSTPTPDWTPTVTWSSTITPTPTITQTPSPTLTPTISFTPTITPTPTASSTATWSPTITLTPSPSATPTEACREVWAYPNPLAPDGTLHLHFSPCDQGQRCRLRLFTTAYRKVFDRSLSSSEVADDTVLVVRDDWGNELANGLYYLVIDSNRGRTVRKLIVLK